MRTPARALTIMLTAACATTGIIAGAEAAPRRGDYGYVTAESRYSTQTITAPVRYNPQGRLEVRLPGGTWIECGRSCRETLRRESIDFWASRDVNKAGGQDGPGLFGLHFRY